VVLLFLAMAQPLVGEPRAVVVPSWDDLEPERDVPMRRSQQRHRMAFIQATVTFLLALPASLVLHRELAGQVYQRFMKGMAAELEAAGHSPDPSGRLELGSGVLTACSGLRE